MIFTFIACRRLPGVDLMHNILPKALAQGRPWLDINKTRFYF